MFFVPVDRACLSTVFLVFCVRTRLLAPDSCRLQRCLDREEVDASVLLRFTSGFLALVELVRELVRVYRGSRGVSI